MRKTTLTSAQDVLEMLAADIAERNSGITVTGFSFSRRGDVRWGIEWFDEVDGAQRTFGATLYDAWLALAHHASGTDVAPF